MTGSNSKDQLIDSETHRLTPLHIDALKGRQILLVNGDQVAAQRYVAAFRECGAEVIGPLGNIDHALEAIATTAKVEAAVIDLDVTGETLFPLAQELARRRLPFVFSSTFRPQSEGEAAVPRAPRDIEKVLATLATRLGGTIADDSGGPEARSHPVTRNRLLQIMPPEIITALAPHLRRIELKPRQMLVEEKQLIPAVWFPETAVIAILVAAEGVRPIEVGMIGMEGMTDLVLHPGERSALRSSVLIPGTALIVGAEAFAEVMAKPGFDHFVLAYKEALAIQFAFAALSHGTATIDARLARWILMLHDRLEGDVIPVVHNQVAELLAVRRSGVTTALHVLEGLGAIKSVRGMIMVRDRSVLKQLAAGTYGAPEAEYERLMGRVSRFGP